MKPEGTGRVRDSMQGKKKMGAQTLRRKSATSEPLTPS